MPIQQTKFRQGEGSNVLSNFEKNLLKAVGLILFIGLLGAVIFLRSLGDNTGYAPTQPLPFSHKRHAGDNNIPCMYCHSNVDKSKHATVPSMNVCMNCHSVVKTDSPLIQQVQKTYKEGKAFEWVKVHDLPDFVYFNHSVHIAKGFDCATCHGDVKNMAKIEQVESLNMGFCVSCHRKNGGPTECSTCHH